jgi:hypothetical protein
MLLDESMVVGISVNDSWSCVGGCFKSEINYLRDVADSVTPAWTKGCTCDPVSYITNINPTQCNAQVIYFISLLEKL